MSRIIHMAVLSAVSLAAALAARLTAWPGQWLPNSLLGWCLTMAVTVGAGLAVWSAVKRPNHLPADRFVKPENGVKNTKDSRKRSRRSARRAAAAGRPRAASDTSCNSNSSCSSNEKHTRWHAFDIPSKILQLLRKAYTALAASSMYVLQYSAASAAGTLSRLSTRIAGWAGVPPPPQQQQPQQTEQQRQQEQNHQQNMLQSRSSSAASAFLRSMGSRNGSLQGLHAAPGMFQRNSSNGTSLLLSGYSSMALADGLIYPCCGSGPSGLSLRHSLQRPSCSMARQLSMFTPASSGSAGVPQVAHSEVPEHHGQVLVLYVDKTQKDQATVTSLLGGQSGGEQQSSTSDASSSSELQQGSTWGSRGSSISATTNSSSSSSGGSRTSDVSTASGSSLAATNGVTGQSREFKVVCVGTGRAAIDWVFCAKHLPDIVLLDAALPDMSATEVCKVLRLLFSPLELPILLVSARSGEADALAALDKGVNDFLLKPLRRMELQARINSQLLVKQSARREAEARSHYELLAQVLPSHIIHRLALGQAYAPEHHDQVTILFSDIVGFTELCSRWTTQEVVVLLDALFSSFDDICDRHGVFKVETIGDAYMIACGHDCSTRDHALRMAAAAVDMLAATEEISEQIGSTVQIRIGMHTGHALSGVVGKRRPRYCFFGDTVNVASRMESSGHPMTIHLSEACKESMLAAAAASAAPAAAAPSTQGSVQLSLQSRRGSRDRLSRTASVSFGRNIPPATAAAAAAAVLSTQAAGGSLAALAAAAVAAAAKAEQPGVSSGEADGTELTFASNTAPRRSSESGGSVSAFAGVAAALKPIRCCSPFQGASVKPLPKASDPFAEAEHDDSSSSRFHFKLPAAVAAILSAVANSSSSSSRKNSNRAASGEGLPSLASIATARSGTGLVGSGRQLSRPAEKVQGLPWEMFDLGFHQVKGKGLMKTHLLKVGKWEAALRTVKVRQAAAASATAAAAPNTPTTQDVAGTAHAGAAAKASLAVQPEHKLALTRF